MAEFNGVFLGPARGDGINKWNTAENAETIIHTVPATDVLYLYTVTFHAHNVGAAAGIATLHVRNHLDVLQYNIYCVCCLQNQSVLDSASFASPPRIIPNWDIVVSSDSANLTACAYISGYEVPTP